MANPVGLEVGAISNPLLPSRPLFQAWIVLKDLLLYALASVTNVTVPAA